MAARTTSPTAGQRVLVFRAKIRIAAAADRLDRGLEAWKGGALQVLELHAKRGPASGRRTMVFQRASDAAVRRGPIAQPFVLGCGHVGALEPQFYRAPYRFQQLRALECLLQRRLFQIGELAAVCCEPLQQLVDLPSRFNSAAGDRAQFSIDLCFGVIANTDRGLNQPGVDVDSTVIYRRIQLPDRLLGGAEVANTPKHCTLGQGVLLAVPAQPLDVLRIVVPVDLVRILASSRVARPRHSQHQRPASLVLALLEAERLRNLVQRLRATRRQLAWQRCRSGSG